MTEEEFSDLRDRTRAAMSAASRHRKARDYSAAKQAVSEALDAIGEAYAQCSLERTPSDELAASFDRVTRNTHLLIRLLDSHPAGELEEDEQ
jgi:hypothetical protein